MADLNPTPEAVKGKEGALRDAFKQKFGGEIGKGVYDQRDLDRLEKEDGYARCFLRTLKAKGDPAKAAEVVDEAFKFRKEIGIWDLTDDSFPKDLWDRNGVYYKGKTKDGFKILYVQSKSNTASNKEEKALMRKFMAYHLEQHHRTNCEEFCVLLFDMHGTSTSNMDVDISKYIVTCLATYFPAFSAYTINYELPTLLNAVWALVSAFLSKEQKGKVFVIGKKDLGKYLDDATRANWPHMV